MLYLVAWRNIKAQYAQSALGVGWAVIKPIVTMIVFTVIFGNLARISSDGVPYAIFSYTAIVPWNYFSSALTVCSNSLIAGRGMIDKVYFPRLILPLSGLVSKLLDFAVALALMGVLLLWYQQVPTMGVLFLPFLVLIMMFTVLGLGTALAALAVQYRDISVKCDF
jgi:lipopolysaccharide transport system permease protein